MDLISVIVPVYKVDQYLNRCVESIVNQTYKNLEIILVDDGSPDDCPTICDTWAKKNSRIKVIHKTNGGLSDARNAGLETATGQYIAFVDSDDWIQKTFIDYLYRAITNTGADLSACDVRFVPDGEEVSDSTEPFGTVQTCLPEEAIGELLKGCSFRATVWNKLYKAELLSGETFEIGRLHEDEFFSYRIFDKCRRLAFVDLPLYCYCQRANSIMSTYSIGHLDALEAYSRRLELLKHKYPNLYQRDKVSFCVACLNLYCDALTNKFDNNAEARSRIKEYRRRIHFSLNEIMHNSIKKQIYVIGTLPLLIDLFAKLRVCRGYQ